MQVSRNYIPMRVGIYADGIVNIYINREEETYVK